MSSNLVNVFYTYCGENTYECTTNDFNKWLIEHNKERIKAGNEPEEAEEFTVEPTAPYEYKENEDE
jgi:hypothetical protein